MTERATFGAELRRLRREAGLSLAELATRTHYSKGYLSKVETGLAAPNAALAALCESVLGGAGTLGSLLPGRASRRRSRSDVKPAGLPPLTTDFVGRVEELHLVRRILATDGGVCVVSGLGGVGKTALAVRCAHRLEAGFPDGCLFLDLKGSDADTATPASLLDRLLRLLGVAPDLVPADPDDRAALYRSCLRGRTMLLVLDNAANAAQVRPLLPAEPKCRVLITSRSRLAAIDEAQHVSLGVLPTTVAVDLVARLADATPDDVAARVAEHCGRLPLAIRIATARLRTRPAWNLAELEQRLAAERHRLDELDDGERSVTATFQLSVQQLSAAESRLLGLLALHPGGDFDLYAVSALSGLPLREADQVLGRLHNRYLLDQYEQSRYRLHDLVRTFAGDVMLPNLAAPDRTAAFRRLVGFAVRGAALADQLIAPRRYRPAIGFDDAPEVVRLDDDEMALAWFHTEWPNLVAMCRAATERGEHERCWQLAFFLRSFFFTGKLWDAWIATHRWARTAAVASGDQWALATTTSNLGVALLDRGEIDEAAVCYQEALEIYEQFGDEHGRCTALAHRAWVAHYRGDHTNALHDLRIAVAHYDRTGNQRSAAITRRGVALVLTALGQTAEAIAIATELLPAFEALGLPLDAAMTQNCLGWAWFHAGRPDLAVAAYWDAIARARACGSNYETARAFTGLGNIAAADDLRDKAVVLWAQADDTHPGLDPVTVGEVRVRREYR
ncbi:ATP-binding protein [Amycolatopsis suaedae]|uniref:Tetratricopeptide repeat protein n=1 Tax=Amycolatopsis suaedae TaxID=2510978 RepID=A0A4Q7JAI7_9PSEU|nr:tetratricopeptide repeat protein [Amycolatopsis suaedae]RZQ64820.1 tetratricopeptide repeat protein [Amycolatopsis suaedae]